MPAKSLASVGYMSDEVCKNGILQRVEKWRQEYNKLFEIYVMLFSKLHISRVQVISFLTVLLLCLQVRAQYKEPQVINAGGGYYTQGDLLIDWSFGELLSVQTLNSNSGFIVTTGFLQSKVDALTPFNPIGSADSNKIFAGPNPTNSIITIRSTVIEPGRIQIVLTNEHGKVLQKFEEMYEGIGYQKQLNIATYPSGFYFVFVTYLNGGRPMKTATYKIIKL